MCTQKTDLEAHKSANTSILFMPIRACIKWAVANFYQLN